jgi:hypothetical protein
MAYDTERKRYDKRHLWVVELEVNGVTQRFCEDVSPMPIGLNAVPTLRGMPSVNPAVIDLKGGIGVRAKCNVSFTEHQDYTVYGTIQNPVRFWSRWRAENPYYLGQRVSVLSGYIPENNVFDEANFTRRDYILETFSQTAGGVTITGKDPLKLASNDRAKAPRESKGSLLNAISDTETTFLLQPSGIGDAEYPASNGIIRIGDEVMLYTTRSGDSISGLTRGYYNTDISAHSENDTVQLCLLYDGQTVDAIDSDLLINYANVDPSYIPSASWAAEVSDAFIVTYTALITEPVGVQELLEEFAQSAPHYLYYDERVNQIQLKALKPPPSDAVQLNYEGNFLGGSTSVTDKQDMRISTVICRFGIINPVKDLDETSNYRAAYVRVDTNSVANYGQEAYKIVNSRWIASDNQTAAVLMAARVGRRFSDAPRQFNCSLDAKDADVWAGDDVLAQTDLIEQAGGGFPYLNYQVISASEKQNFDYQLLEHTYGPALPQDEGVEDPDVRLVYIATEIDQLKDDVGNVRTLRQYYEDIYGTDPLEAQLDVRFIFNANAVAGSSDNTQYAVRTGAWPELTTPILIQNNGLIVGKGGFGGNYLQQGGDGGPALQLQANIRLNNLNTIGGGGGGGTGGQFTESGTTCRAGGGGGAGYTTGLASGDTSVTPGNATVSIQPAQNGTNKLGGNGGQSQGLAGGIVIKANGTDGGNLGLAGDPNLIDGVNGGAAGKAIDLNGFTITYINTGTIAGAVS